MDRMQIVVDTSVIIAVVAREPEKDRLVEMTVGARLVAPHSVHWEVGNAFSAMLKRRRVELAQVLAALTVYKQIPIHFLDVELDASLYLAAENNCYAYDAYLLRCAQKYRLPLLSLDRKLVGVAERIGIRVLEVER